MKVLTKFVPATDLKPGMEIVQARSKKKIKKVTVRTVEFSRKRLSVIVNGRLIYDQIGKAEVLA